jgi:hypothetical protein
MRPPAARAPTRLPRALRALAHEPVVTEDGPHPLGQRGAAASCEPLVVLAGRATHVPQAAGTSGHYGG